MEPSKTPTLVRGQALWAGLLYLVIIFAGVWSEAFVRMALVVPEDAAETAANILANEGLFRLGLAADTIMAVCDVGLAVLLYLLLRPVGATIALLALVFRLVQTAILGGNLINQVAALQVLTDTSPVLEPAAQALHSLQLHAAGYDLALVFFGMSCVMLGILLYRADWAPKVIGWLIFASGIVYLTGSFLRLLAPSLAESFAYAYALPLLAESALALLLVAKGLRRPSSPPTVAH
ncbi:DUF4386 domain-containing protein [Defluviimonas sp. WL0002]|uniref:DUF4386 domain-containing protein n=1 Tax=Albidovulum marisflavi TaxID=2984159 RepID=A0ABT2ZFY2_9RHOB|nr:DUF4386 domain-containing protein [Defluviimonas sp. WL0002]MCV2870004.1 DUF4386 domain-containing protein [Defluviimonas sp. WL0002]